jgi:hypothetical protein
MYEVAARLQYPPRRGKLSDSGDKAVEINPTIPNVELRVFLVLCKFISSSSPRSDMSEDVAGKLELPPRTSIDDPGAHDLGRLTSLNVA